MWNLLGAIGRKVQSFFQPKPQPKPQSQPQPKPQSQPAKVQGPGLGWNKDYAQFSNQGQFTGIKSTPQPGRSYPSQSGGGGSSSGGGSSYSSPSQSYSAPEPAQPAIFDMGAFQRKLQQEASNVGKGLSSGMSNLMGAIGRRGQVLAGDKDQNLQDESLKTKFGKGLENLGTMFKLPELKWSEGLAGGATPLTGQTEQSAKVFSPYRYTPEEKIGATGDINGMQLGFTPGEKAQYVGQQTLSGTPPSLGEGGGGNVGQFLGNLNPDLATLIQESLAAPTQISPVEIENLDAAVQQISAELGIPQAQAAQQVVNEQIMQVGDSIEALDAEVSAEGQNALMTEDQRRRLINARAKPLRDQLAKLVRSAQYLGVNMQNLMSMLSQRLEAKKATITSQMQAAQLAQQAEEERKKRLMGLLPYTQPTAAELLPYTRQKMGTAKSGGGSDFSDMDLASLMNS